MHVVYYVVVFVNLGYFNYVKKVCTLSIFQYEGFYFKPDR
jgi:hypothetical protein